MSIRIDKITRGRFGNKILQYNSLLQISNNNNVIPSCCDWEGNNFFKEIVPFIKSDKTKKGLFCKQVLEDDELDFQNYDYIIDDPAYLLNNVFYKITNKDPRNFLVLKDEYKPELQANTLNIGIHLRGGDILSVNRNGREIHEFEYYKNAIDYVVNNLINKDYLFIVCTDDKKFQSFIKTVNYLKENNYKFKLGDATKENKHYIYDWNILSECDILINSSSTFCITAGFLGKKNKYIIHSNKWIEKNINHTSWNSKGENIMKMLGYSIKTKDYWKYYDDFWIEVSKCNVDKFYYCNKLI